MRLFALGFVLGAVAGSASIAVAAALVGGNGWLNGWDVKFDGETICSDPYVWTSTREIECD